MDTVEPVADVETLPKPDPFQTAMDVCKYLLVGAAACYLLIYTALAFIRLSYPYELEWIEGACVDHVRWILSGKPLYVEPSAQFVPFCYTPLYFYVSAALAKVTGVGFLPLRLVSLAASLGCFAILFQFVRRASGSAMWGLIAAGLFAATYQAGGAWFDIARVDTLFLLLVLAGVYVLRFGEGVGPLLLAGLLLVLAFLTKQTTLLIAVPLGFYAFLAKPRAAAYAFAGTLLAGLIVSTGVLNVLTGGWYVHYVFTMSFYHDLLPGQVVRFWTEDLARPLGVALVLSIFAIAGPLSRGGRRGVIFLAMLAAGMVGCSWIARLHGGGYDNVLLPAFAFLAIGLGLGGRFLESEWLGKGPDAEQPSGADTPAASLPGAGSLIALYCAVLLQFALLWYSPSGQIPRQSDAAAGDGLIAALRGIEGEVWIPYHGYLPVLAGHQSFHAHAMAVNDVLRGPGGKFKQGLIEDIRRTIAERKYAAIILDDEWQLKTPEWQPIMKALAQQYEPLEPVFAERGAAMLPVTGWMTSPRYVALARQNAPQSQPQAVSPASQP